VLLLDLGHDLGMDLGALLLEGGLDTIEGVVDLLLLDFQTFEETFNGELGVLDSILRVRSRLLKIGHGRLERTDRRG